MADNNMYQLVFDKTNEEPFYHKNFQTPTQRFVAWYLRNVHGLREVQVSSCVTDGKNEKFIDAVYTDEAATTVYIIHCEYVRETDMVDSPKVRSVLAQWAQIENLAKLKDVGNEKINQKLVDLSDAILSDYSIVFEFVTTGKLTEAAQRDFAAVRTHITQNKDVSAELVLVDQDELDGRYQRTLNRGPVIIKHVINLPQGKFMPMILGNIRVIVACVPLAECVKLPGIKDGTLFEKNVRQSLGLNNTVNKGIKETVFNDSKHMFFYHNGITANCTRMALKGNQLYVEGISVVNGCQSLSTVLACSDKARYDYEGFILFRFYEIPDDTLCLKISVATNSQSAVKARDLRSNDKKILFMKQAYEERYPHGFFICKRNEQAPANKDWRYIIDVSDLGREIMAWQLKRPNMSYSENLVFDTYFLQVFHKDFPPEDMQALNELMHTVMEKWDIDNPLGLNETLLALSDYAPYHHLFAISACFCMTSGVSENLVPRPSVALAQLKAGVLVENIVAMAGKCLDNAFDTAVHAPQEEGVVFSPQNWIKSKQSLYDIQNAIEEYVGMLSTMSTDTAEISASYTKAFMMAPEQFEERWTTD